MLSFDTAGSAGQESNSPRSLGVVPPLLHMTIPFPMITSEIVFVPSTDGNHDDGAGSITIYAKDFRVVVFQLPSAESYTSLEKIAFPFFRESFSLSHRNSSVSGLAAGKWKMHSWSDQLKREGLNRRKSPRVPWTSLRLSGLSGFSNKAYYGTIVVPSTIAKAAKQGDVTSLIAATNHREGGYFPVYTWGCWDGENELYGAALLRGRRPASAYRNKFTHERGEISEDLELMEAIYVAANTRQFIDTGARVPIQVIDTGVDPSPAGQTTGLLVDLYGRQCAFRFLSLSADSLCDSYFALYATIVRAHLNEADEQYQTLRDFRTSPAVTKWSQLAIDYIYHAREIVTTLRKHHQVFIQGGVAGLSAEASLSALTQLLVDPYARSLPGFCDLIRKEFLALQYTFGVLPPQRIRSSVLPARVQEWEVGMFHFLYCVWVLTEFQPTMFEFGSPLLIFMCDSLFDERFGTFAFADEASRRQMGAPTKTMSIFHYILDPDHVESFTNPTYRPHNGILEPVVGAVNIWWEYLLRWSSPADLTASVIAKVRVAVRRKEPKPVVVLERLDLSTLCANDLQSIDNAFSLSLANNVFVSLPASILCLTRLQTLNLSFNEFAKAPPLLAYFSTLRSLTIKRNPMDDISGVMWSRLAHLHTLNLDTNKLTDFPAHLFSTSTCLESLHLTGNHISLLPSELSLIDSLTFLDISRNRLRSFPYSACSLPNLKFLILSHNRLGTLPSRLSQLTSLEVLNVSDNKLVHLPDLPQRVNFFDASENGLVALPSSMGLLMDVTVVKLTANKLTDLPHGMAHCVSLQQLFLGANKFTVLPPVVKEFRELLTLELRRNYLAEIPTWLVQLQLLKSLNVSDNNLSDLPHTLSSMPALDHLVVDHNPLTRMPSEVVQSSDSAFILDYLRQLNQGSQASYRLKLMVVGQENVGKTSCIRALARDGTWEPLSRPGTQAAPLDNLSTDGIDIRDYHVRVRELELAKHKPARSKLTKAFSGLATVKSKKGDKEKDKTGDVRSLPFLLFSLCCLFICRLKSLSTFGILLDRRSMYSPPPLSLSLFSFSFLTCDPSLICEYTTHQLFLQNRCVYLIVFNLADPDTDRVTFWLQSLVSRIDVVNTPIVMVGTHADDPSFATSKNSATALMNKLRDRHRSQFPTLRKMRYFPVSCSTGEGVTDLRLSLQEVIARQPSLGELYPKSYILLEQMLQDRRATYPNLPVIDRAQLLGLGAVCGMGEAKQVIDCVMFLSRIGSVLYFPDDPLISNLVVLDPQWLIDVMATLFTTKNSWIRDGLLKHSDLPHIWKEYPAPIHPFLIHLFHRFQICFLLPTSFWSNATQILNSPSSSSASNLGSSSLATATPSSSDESDLLDVRRSSDPIGKTSSRSSLSTSPSASKLAVQLSVRWFLLTFSFLRRRWTTC